MSSDFQKTPDLDNFSKKDYFDRLIKNNHFQIKYNEKIQELLIEGIRKNKIILGLSILNIGLLVSILINLGVSLIFNTNE